MNQVFNNREISVFVWSCVLFIFCLRNNEMRKSIANLLRSFFKWDILLPLVAMSIYLLMCILFLQRIGFWTLSGLKDTLLWAFGVGAVMMFRAANPREQFVQEAVLDNFKVTAILEFISNTYTFNLPIELMFVPFTTLVAMMKTLTESQLRSNNKYSQVDKALGFIQWSIGICILCVLIYKTAQGFAHFATKETLRDFLLPGILSALYIPCIYLWILFLSYNYLFFRINIFNKDKSISNHLKIVAIIHFHFKLGSLRKWAKNTPNLKIERRDDAIALVEGSL